MSEKKLNVQIFSSNKIIVLEILDNYALTFSFQQQISSFNKFDAADLEIFFGQGFYTFEKHLVIFTEKVYGMLSKLVPSIDICNCPLP